MPEEFDLTIEPDRGFQNYWRDLWRYHELFVFLAWRDILVRYKQTILGLSWSILRPFLILIVPALARGLFFFGVCFRGPHNSSGFAQLLPCLPDTFTPKGASLSPGGFQQRRSG